MSIIYLVVDWKNEQIVDKFKSHKDADNFAINYNRKIDQDNITKTELKNNFDKYINPMFCRYYDNCFPKPVKTRDNYKNYQQIINEYHRERNKQIHLAYLEYMEKFKFFDNNPVDVLEYDTNFDLASWIFNCS